MPRRCSLSRRQFLAHTSRTAAAIGAGSLLAAPTARAAMRRIGANDRITLGIIGSGGQGTHDCDEACQANNVVCVALCDVAKFRMDHAEKTLSKTMADKDHSGIKIDRYGDYRALLDRKDIDGVIIATPDHWHCEPFVAACEAEKHIYQEKPFSFTIEQGMKMVAAAEKQSGLTIQIGTQRRSRSNYLPAKQLIDNGKLGKIGFVRTFDCRNYISGRDPFTPEATAERSGAQVDWKHPDVDWDTFQKPCEHKVPFDPVRYTAWRWYWDYAGGLVTDVGVHVIDNVHWLLGEPTPKSAVCNGGVYGLDYWETPDIVNAVWDYGTFSMAFTSNFCNGFEGDGFIIYGTDATMEVRGNHIQVWGNGPREKPLHEWPSEGIPHQHNWIHCIRSGERPNAPVQLGFSSLLPSHLANLAYRTGTRITWDSVAKKVDGWFSAAGSREDS